MKKTGVLVAGVLALASGCSKTLDVNSAWAARPIVVDGRGDDWADVELQHVSDGDLSFGIANDATHVYLLLATQDRPVVRAIQHWGATLWLDPTAGKKKELGLHFRGGPGPDDGERIGGPADESPRGRRGGYREGRRDTEPDAGEAAPPPEPRALELEVVDAGGEIHPLEREAVDAPRAAVERSEDTWTYEVALPLATGGGAPVALRAGPGAKVDLGVELVLPKHDMGGPASRAYGPRIGGRVGGPTGWGVVPGVEPGGARRRPPKPPETSDVWLVVKLAPTPATPLPAR